MALTYRRVEPVAECIGCKCNDFRACLGGCSWLRVDYAIGLGVCSHCPERMAAWDAGSRDIQGDVSVPEVALVGHE
jgi:hypothetical protein